MSGAEVAEVVFEIRVGDRWQPVGSVSEDVPPGSISSEEPGGRQVFVFGWLSSGSGPGVWRSRAGVDVENAVARDVITIGLDRLADLGAEPFEMEWRQGGRTVVVRFRCASADDTAMSVGP